MAQRGKVAVARARTFVGVSGHCEHIIDKFTMPVTFDDEGEGAIEAVALLGKGCGEEGPDTAIALLHPPSEQ